ncbi:sensor domain-containing protein [Plantactinospora sp. CA-290183]|uniref:sensor histidine kinase n=1 Tax=Plantactinospora sp. CA-290183 TaxID=3240006 RepID=UPI003D9115AB
MEEAVRRAARTTYWLATASGLALLSYAFLGVIAFAGILTLTVIGAGVLPETALVLRQLAGFKRRQVARRTGVEIPEAYRPLAGPLAERVRTALTDPQTVRDLRWLLIHLGYGLLLLYLALVVWSFVPLVDGVWAGLLRRRPILLPLIERIADLDATWSRALLRPAPNTRLADRVAELTATRADAIAAHGAELRRIERDLHDGAQARLVALSLRLGLVRRAYDRDPETGRRLLDEAQSQAEEALSELRHLVRGIYPPILTDRGLTGAVRALAAGSGLAATVELVGFAGPAEPRPPAAVEAAGYFVVAEALTNAAKHSGSRGAQVRLVREPRALRIRVRDEGRGGADEAGGSGLLGIRRRVAALDGTMQVTSPAGGPTTIEVELPCVW